ncbi:MULTISPECIES: Lrp/AsnC family transcriptional regulator [Amycolatopsis]|uniref:Lrp/AsnC family transcriptional regulator n=1 Tax=Amycolatopsis albidoflavus TaxID=102226 RepID=A0ABW5HUU3_9PSEU
MLTENDLKLVDALQAGPRAPWSAISTATGMSAVTAARRWQRLAERRDAWFAAYPGGGVRKWMTPAFIEVDCVPGKALATAQELADDPNVASIDHTAGRCDLLVHVLASTSHGLETYLEHRVAALSSVTAIRTLVSPRILSDGSTWRVRSGRSGAPGPPTPQFSAPVRFDPLDRALLHALGADGRAAASTLAAQLNVGETTVRRRLTALLDSGELVLRCEIARSLSPAPVTAILWIQVPPGRIDDAGRALTALPETRMCAAVNGIANLLLVVWLSSEYQLVTLENVLATAQPWLSVADRAITLRPVKLMGHLLDGEGRPVKYVPLAFPS